MRDVIVTVVGNVGADPVVRETSSGRVTNFNLGATRRMWDRRSESWVDGPTTWYRVASWNQLGANVAESLRRGERVVVVGRLQIVEYQDRDGVERVRAEIQADHVGHELTFGITRFTRVLRSASLLGGAGPSTSQNGADGVPGTGDQTGAAWAATQGAGARRGVDERVGWHEASVAAEPADHHGTFPDEPDRIDELDELDNVDELEDLDELGDLDELEPDESGEAAGGSEGSEKPISVGAPSGDGTATPAY